MRAVVLGAAAGGGFPQWNSNAEACRRARAGDARRCAANPGVARRERRRRALVPDQRLARSSPADPGARDPSSADAACAPRRSKASSLPAPTSMRSPGLLHLRERQPFTLYASERVLAVLKANPIFGVLADGVRAPAGRAARPAVRAASCRWQRERPRGRAVRRSGQGRAVARDRRVAAAELAGKPGDTVGVEVRAGGRRLLYIPGCARHDRWP